MNLELFSLGVYLCVPQMVLSWPFISYTLDSVVFLVLNISVQESALQKTESSEIISFIIYTCSSYAN